MSRKFSPQTRRKHRLKEKTKTAEAGQKSPDKLINGIIPHVAWIRF